MKIFILVTLLIPIFAFQIYIIINTISSIKIPTAKSSVDMETMSTDDRKALRRSNLKVLK